MSVRAPAIGTRLAVGVVITVTLFVVIVIAGLRTIYRLEGRLSPGPAYRAKRLNPRELHLI